MHPTIEALVGRFNDNHSAAAARDCPNLQQENEELRSIIEYLQSTLDTREETVQELKAGLEQAAEALYRSESAKLSVCHGETCDEDDSDSVTIITESPQSTIEY
ncbi:hypothetical protein N7532_001399 [Penicillium argentinense]|uniref:Uncharacterized protein n=1 Tax=Penicillium argentinense TaxID=1131581 RepID=A0A9W9KL78_9EURO|nr:uncharacterized protein N7532_001399 [Penicillium argentinense]KAJ5110864.1 hypothetical protein N7532_001399 [Penicillium argentinense]